MKVALITTFPPSRDGVADYSHDLAEELSKHVDLHVLCYGNSENNHADYSVHNSLSSGLFSGINCWNALKALNIDLIHLQSTPLMHPVMLNTFVFFKGGTPLITTVHETVKSFRMIYYKPFLRYVYKKSDAIIVHSKNVGSVLVNDFGVNKSKIFQLSHGVDLFEFSPEKRGGENKNFTVLFFGFITPGKGLEYLIRSMIGVVESSPRIKLVIAGDVPQPSLGQIRKNDSTGYLNGLKKLVYETGLNENVEFLGFVPKDEVPGLLANSDIFVCPHLDSAQSGPLHKALASGCCIIASDVGGFSEILENGKDAVLVPRADYSAIGDAVVRLYKDKILRRKLGKNARKKAESKLSWKDSVKQTLELYSKFVP